VSGCVVAIISEWGLSVAVLGVAALLAYFGVIALGVRLAPRLEPKPCQLHRLWTF
jgi:hypothetical protein